MQEELIIAGAGGQGILLIGKIICLAAMEEDKYTIRFPSYGPAMRGGEATCTVIVSSEEIGSPISDHPDSLIVMNRPSLKFVKLLKPGGLLILNKSLADWDASRKGIKVVEIRASEIAQKIGSPMSANLVMLGAYLKEKNIFSLEKIEKILEKEPGYESNKKALLEGFSIEPDRLL